MSLNLDKAARAARAARDRAMRARRLARHLSQAADRDRLARFADENDRRAEELENEVEALRSTRPKVTAVEHQQMQPQQQLKAEVGPGKSRS